MTEAELMDLCAEQGFEWAAGEHDSERGWFLHWPNPHDAQDQQVAFIEAAQLPGLDAATVRRSVIKGRNVE